MALAEIRERWRFEHGKIIQLLLAISLGKRRGGYSVANYLSEGVDVTMLSGDAKFAVEVKTTDGTLVNIEEKDISGLKRKCDADGYVPVIGALTIQRSSAWIMANAKRFCAGQYSLSRLSLDSIVELESVANIQFEKTVAELGEAVLSPPRGAPQDFLQEILQEESQTG